jgi:hypothetical protein
MFDNKELADGDELVEAGLPVEEVANVWVHRGSIRAGVRRTHAG